MVGLTPEVITELLASGPRRKSSTGRKGYALVKTSNGLERVPLNTVELGHFEGRQGTIKRSRKGRTSIRANGRRYYVPYGNPDNVVAYKT